MVDVVDKKTRSRMMSGIQGKNTGPEMLLRHYLHARGFRYRLHVANLPGKPDLVLPKYRLCIFVHGCFWHRHPECRYATTPATNRDFWLKKLTDNRERDERSRLQLQELGWRVFEIWECGLRKSAGASLDWLPEQIIGECESLSWPDYVQKG
ncbi:very short patch repair endonuclease [Zobellella taiwanensis]|uniref:Very short patch repair endonuclease n=1 Tax=Zobellella taiwanensis TaxID=347535 RepID=A0A2P7R743_9GAMM|nr:DNA mismatch endonuclease Vsr [Zobellella taiwanensis]PSJ46027.1 very short patch repair endonuclease [Zobellella taiwanensis]